MFKAELFECLRYLTAAVVDPVRPTDEGDQHIPARSFVQHDFRVARGDDLAVGLCRCFAEKLVGLALTQNLQVGIRFVEQQNGTRIGSHVREQQERLLFASTAGGQVEAYLVAV